MTQKKIDQAKTPELKEMLKLRKEGLSMRKIEEKIFGAKSNGSWALFNLRKLGVK